MGLGGCLNPNCVMWSAAIKQFGEGSLMGNALRAVSEAAMKVPCSNPSRSPPLPLAFLSSALFPLLPWIASHSP